MEVFSIVLAVIVCNSLFLMSSNSAVDSGEMSMGDKVGMAGEVVAIEQIIVDRCSNILLIYRSGKRDILYRRDRTKVELLSLSRYGFDIRVRG